MLDLGLFVSTLAAFGGWFFNSVEWIVQTTRSRCLSSPDRNQCSNLLGQRACLKATIPVSTLAAFGGWFFNSVEWIVQTTRLFYCQQGSPVNVWDCSLKTCSLTEQVGTLVPILVVWTIHATLLKNQPPNAANVDTNNPRSNILHRASRQNIMPLTNKSNKKGIEFPSSSGVFSGIPLKTVSFYPLFCIHHILLFYPLFVAG
jgi:hypothetical protein